MDAYTELNNKINTLKERINELKNNYDVMQATLSICVRKSDLTSESTRLSNDITNMSDVITKLETKLAKVLLPEDTKYYLDEDELKNIRNKIRQMNALIIRLQELEKHVITTLNRDISSN